MSSQKLYKYYIAASVVSWLLLITSDLYMVICSAQKIDFLIPDSALIFTECLFYLSVFLTFRELISKRGNVNFNEQLWQVFIIGATTVLASLFIKFSLGVANKTSFADNVYLINIIYQVNTALVAIFIANAFYVWKKMILFQRTNRTNIAWIIFETITILSVASNYFYFDFNDPYFYLFTAPLTFLGLTMSFNLKWVAFLNYKQKWNSILMVVLIALISLTFVQQLFEYHSNNLYIVDVYDLTDNVFILAIFAFILLNCFTSFLVLVFHLPTSSVFEQKFGEVMIFQRLSQSIQEGKEEEEVYEILIDSALTTVMADAGWLEIIDEKGNYKAFLSRSISEFDIFEIKKILRKNHINITDDPQYIKDIRQLNHTERIDEISSRSFLLIPLYSHNQHLGTLALLKNIVDGFDKEMVDTIFSFVSQASMAIKNFRLITEAVETERYKEEIKIARDVQRSLLPETLMFNIQVDMWAYSKGAEEVGGDYYDIFRFSENKFSIVIGDVSGHGTSAAFNMAQMKGVFQSLSQMDLSCDRFMIHANNALSKCLEKKSFITLSYFIIDTEKKSIQFARAGHCPTLYYSAKEGKASYMQSKGLGLGIIRSEDYAKHIEKQEFNYESGDIMVLYTDGIVEATNSLNEEFGYERLEVILNDNCTLSPKQLVDKTTEELYNFTGTKDLNDDYTSLIVKFV